MARQAVPLVRRLDYLGAAIGLGCVGLTLLVVGVVPVKILALIAAVVVSAIQFKVLQRAAATPIPFVAIPVVVLNLVAVTGVLFYAQVGQTALVSFPLPDDAVTMRTGLIVFALASLGFFVGGLAGCVRRRGEHTSSAFVRETIAESSSRLRAAPTLLVAAIPLALVVYGFSPGQLVNRSYYLATAGNHLIFISAGGLLSPIGFLVTTLFALAPGRRAGRFVGTVLMVAYTLTLFARGSRELATVPIILIIGWLATRPSVKLTPVWGTITVVLWVWISLCLLQLTLSLRSLGGDAGLQPYLTALSAQPSLIFTLDFSGLAGNILFSVPLAGTLAHSVTAIPTHDYVTSLNPLPGRFTDWSSIQPTLGLNQVTPYSALGELANAGWDAILTYTFVVGALFSWIQTRAPRLTAGASTLITAAGVALSGLFSLSLLEYNLRSGTRLIWYFLLISAGLWWMGRANNPDSP